MGRFDFPTFEITPLNDWDEMDETMPMEPKTMAADEEQKKIKKKREHEDASASPLSLSNLFKENSETMLMDPKTMAAGRAGKEDYLKNNNSYDKLAPILVNGRGDTVLHLAASSGHVRLVGCIVKERPGLLMTSNLMGESALHVAAGAGHLDVVLNLIGCIKDISINNLGVAKRIYFAKNKNKDNALHVALKGKHMLVASSLVSADKSLSFVANKDGVSPLYLAIEAGLTDLVTTMCHETKNLNSMVEGRSIVHAALKAKRKDILVAVLRKDANLINLRDEGRTCLSFAASIGYKKGFCYLLDQDGGKVYLSDDDGSFPIHMVAKYGHIQILEEFLKHCPETLELLDRDGQNILHVAAKHGKLKFIKFILRYYKDKNYRRLISEQDVDGNTPLHLATKNWHPKVVSMFTWDHRVDLKKTNYNGFTALDIAEENIHSSYIKHQRLTWMALISAGAPKGSISLQESLTFSEKPDGEQYKDRVNTLLLVATLVATMTFTAGFTLPGGYNDSFPHIGMALLGKRKAFQVFLICDTLAMYSSIVTIISLLWAQLGDVSIILKAFNIALPFLQISLTTMSIAFMAGTHVVVSNHPLLSYFVLGIGIIFELFLWHLFVPYTTGYAHGRPFLRHILYYPYLILLMAAGDNNNHS